MEKSKTPTSKYQVFCDHFDVEMNAEIHIADGGQKLLITMQNEGSDEKLSLSLYKEDVELFNSFLTQITEFIQKRK